MNEDTQIRLFFEDLPETLQDRLKNARKLIDNSPKGLHFIVTQIQVNYNWPNFGQPFSELYGYEDGALTNSYFKAGEKVYAIRPEGHFLKKHNKAFEKALDMKVKTRPGRKDDPFYVTISDQSLEQAAVLKDRYGQHVGIYLGRKSTVKTDAEVLLESAAK